MSDYVWLLAFSWTTTRLKRDDRPARFVTTAETDALNSVLARMTLVDQDQLVTQLSTAFGGSERALNVVARQARDLADSGRLQEDLGVEATAETVVSNLEDAPDEYSLVERWNWWVGSLDLSQGGYRRFSVRQDIDDQR